MIRSDNISRAIMLRFFLLSKGDEEADKAPLKADKLLKYQGNIFRKAMKIFLKGSDKCPYLRQQKAL